MFHRQILFSILIWQSVFLNIAPCIFRVSEDVFLCSQLLHLSVFNYTHALLVDFISCATIPLLCLRAVLLLCVKNDVPLQCLSNSSERPPEMRGEF